MKNTFFLTSILITFIGFFSACISPTLTPAPTLPPSQTPPTTWLFTHPQQLYSLHFPIGWQQQVVVRDQGYYEVSFTSPAYRVSEGYPVLESGAEFLVIVKPLPAGMTCVEEYIVGNPLLNELAQNRTTLQVAGQPALQFDYSYEGVNALITFFIAQGNIFQVRYRYLDLATRPEFIQEYQELLASFSVNDLP